MAQGRRDTAMLKLLRSEAQVPAVWITGALFLAFGKGWFAAAAASTGLTLALFAWLFAAILWGAFGVVRHAEHLAEKLGEPYGTLILTLSVTIIEVTFIVTAIATGTGSSPVARDAVFAVMMIMLNGTIGLCLLLGGLRHREQSYNLPGARAFLSVVIPLAIFALVLPNFTVRAPGPTLSTPQSITIAALTLALYGVFLAMQTVRHRSFFQDPLEADGSALPEPPPENAHGGQTVAFYTTCLALTLVPAVYLTEELGHIVEHAVKATGAPLALSGVIVAVLVLAPEAMGALQATLQNRLQRAVNISLGSVLATIGLTIPIVLVLGVLKGTPTILGIDQEQMVLLVLTLVVSTLTFGGDRTNMLQGAVHVVMFLVFGLLLFHP
jgi:Ca2+:H+ antiporter